jgi:RpiR family carbohydrate utilization transcriptional regulator
MAEKQNNPITLINNLYASLSKSEKKVAEYIQEHMDEAVLLSLQGIAKKCKTSDPTVLRFCRALGYHGFSDFKISLVPELLRNGKRFYTDLNSNDELKNVKDVFKKNLSVQTDSTLDNTDIKELRKISRIIFSANRVVVVALGGSAGVAQIFCDSLGSLGIFSTYFNDRSVIQHIATILKPKDILIGISHSGETEEVVAAIRKARDNGSTTVGITNSVHSSLADSTKIPLITGVPANLMGSYSCQARISQLVILELILSEIAKLFTNKNS